LSTEKIIKVSKQA